MLTILTVLTLGIAAAMARQPEPQRVPVRARR